MYKNIESSQTIDAINDLKRLPSKGEFYIDPLTKKPLSRDHDRAMKIYQAKHK